MNVVVDGLMTNYQKMGKGQTILFLHGWGDTSTTFSKLAEQLQDQYEIITLDLPGFGATQAPPNAWSLEDYAAFVGNWLKKLQIEDIYAIVGHSYGGSTAIMGLSAGDFKAQLLVLIASAGVRQTKSARKKALLIVSKVGKVPLYALPKHKRQALRQRFYGAIGSDAMLLPHMELTFKRIIGEDVQKSAQNIKIPTLLIYGAKDKDTPVKHGQLLNKAIKDSKLIILPDAGHFLHQQESQRVADLINDFLEAR